jgi:crotonobetainyl-CoA:carnitine CoA-transferase CaiB-like acyl-CoA transferase
VPKFSKTPGKIWRGSVPVGHDNQRVYGDLLGLGAAEIETLKHEKVI